MIAAEDLLDLGFELGDDDFMSGVYYTKEYKNPNPDGMSSTFKLIAVPKNERSDLEYNVYFFNYDFIKITNIEDLERLIYVLHNSTS